MKKKLAMILAGVLAAGMLFAGCGRTGGNSADEAPDQGSAPAASAETDSAPAAAGTGDSIVIGCSFVSANTNPIDCPWELTMQGVSEGVFMQNAEGELVSRFVTDMEREEDGLTWNLALTNAVKFSDGSDCDAQALADCMNYIQAENAIANGTAGVCTFTAADADTLQVVTERPITTLDSLLCEWCNVVFKQVGDGFIYTGPYMVDSLDSGVSIHLVPNPYYDDRAEQRSDVTMIVFNDAAAQQQAFEGGEIDMMFGLSPEVAQILRGEGFTVVDYDAGYQYFVINNIADGPMADLAIRQAVSQIFDREEMITYLGAGRVATGMFAQYYSFAGHVDEITDVPAAQAALEAAGYERNADGMYEKDGEPLTLKLVTYAGRPDLPLIMQMASSELTEAGVTCTTEVVDDIGAAISSGEYDVIFYVHHTAPSGEPAAILNMYYSDEGVQNFYGYHSDEITDLLAQIGSVEPGPERDAIAQQIQDIVAEDLPVTFLIDPQWHVALSERVADYVPYCGDYYIVNAELGL